MPHRLPNEGEAHLILTWRHNQKLYEVAAILDNKELFESALFKEDYLGKAFVRFSKDLLRRVKEDVL